MYAIIECGGRQWKVEPGTHLLTNRRAAPVGSTETLEQVLFAHDGQHAKIGQPYVAGAQVVCEVLEHRLGPKVISYYFRRRENWRKTVGHRQPLTRLLVKAIVLDGKSTSAAAKTEAKSAGKTDIKPKAARSVTSLKTTVTPAPKRVPSKPRNIK
jgi:large subunit ribosomal protein L21